MQSINSLQWTSGAMAVHGDPLACEGGQKEIRDGGLEI